MYRGLPSRLEADVRARYLRDVLKGDESRLKVRAASRLTNQLPVLSSGCAPRVLRIAACVTSPLATNPGCATSRPTLRHTTQAGGITFLATLLRTPQSVSFTSRATLQRNH
jgi:phage tail protein X